MEKVENAATLVNVVSELETLRKKIEKRIELNKLRIDKCDASKDPSPQTHWKEGYLNATDTILNEVLSNIEDVLKKGKE